MTAGRLRREDDALLRGRGRFIDDAAEKNQAFGCFVRSPHAHARIAAIDAAPESPSRDFFIDYRAFAA